MGVPVNEKMTVQNRCGQSNDLSPVLHFYLPMRACNGGVSLADKMRVKMGGGYYREEKIIEI